MKMSRKEMQEEVIRRGKFTFDGFHPLEEKKEEAWDKAYAVLSHKSLPSMNSSELEIIGIFLNPQRAEKLIRLLVDAGKVFAIALASGTLFGESPIDCEAAPDQVQEILLEMMTLVALVGANESDKALAEYRPVLVMPDPQLREPEPVDLEKLVQEVLAAGRLEQLDLEDDDGWN